jgi:hypothetical protein
MKHPLEEFELKQAGECIQYNIVLVFRQNTRHDKSD